MHRRIRPSVAVVALTATAALLAACGAPAEEQAGSITFWTPQSTPERVAAQEAVAERFTQETGIEVDVVPLAAADQDQALVTGAASGEVPDVILAGASQVTSWQSQGLLDTDVVQETLDTLDPATFNENALGAVTVQDADTGESTVAAVPSDGCVHLIAYRTDLLEEAGVEVPTTVAELAQAATAVKEELDVTGIALGTQSGTASGTEGIESIFQSAGCRLVSDGEVTIDSPECTEAAGLFKELRDSSVAGDYDVESARAAYLAGDAAMLLFSTHILDELANLDEAVPPSCEQCADDPEFLAKHSGFITVLEPPGASASAADDAAPAQFGATLAYAVPARANAYEARQYVEFVLGEGYADTLAVATEGRLPLRTGTPESPTEYLDAWGGLGFGPKVESSVAEVYGDDLVTAMGEGMAAVARWGQGTPDATLAGLVATQGTLAQQLDPLYRGTDPADVTGQMAADVTALQQDQ